MWLGKIIIFGMKFGSLRANVTILLWFLQLPVAALYDFPVGTAIRDQEIEDAIFNICEPIYKVAGIPPKKVKHYIVIDPELNAATGAGPTLMLNSGFIFKASASEFAGVVAHESGHMRGRHVEIGQTVIREKQKLAMATMLLGAGAMIANPAAGTAVLLSGPEVALRSFLQFSRGKEASADQAAIEILHKLNWPISGLSKFLKKIEKQAILSSDKPDPYRITHPITDERIQMISHQAHEIQKTEPEFPKKLEMGYEFAKAKLKGFCQPPGVTQNEFRSTYKTSDVAMYAWIISLHKMNRNQEALEFLDKLISKYPQNPYFYELKAQILFLSGKRGQALGYYEKALKLNPLANLIRLSYANALLESSEKSTAQKATLILAPLVTNEKENPEYWRLLSIAYGRSGKIGQMAWCLAEQAALVGDDKLTQQQIQRAEKFLKPGQKGYLEVQDLKNALKNEDDQK